MAILVAVYLVVRLLCWLVVQFAQLVVWLADCLLRIHILGGEIHIVHQCCPCLYGFTYGQLPDAQITILHGEIHMLIAKTSIFS